MSGRHLGSGADRPCKRDLAPKARGSRPPSFTPGEVKRLMMLRAAHADWTFSSWPRRSQNCGAVRVGPGEKARRTLRPSTRIGQKQEEARSPVVVGEDHRSLGRCRSLRSAARRRSCEGRRAAQRVEGSDQGQRREEVDGRGGQPAAGRARAWQGEKLSAISRTQGADEFFQLEDLAAAHQHPRRSGTTNAKAVAS